MSTSGHRRIDESNITNAYPSGCANPFNQATSIRYLEQCYEADKNGHLDIAEQACYRALVHVDWGNLGDEQKGDRLYGLARIKRKLDEAEELLL